MPYSITVHPLVLQDYSEAYAWYEEKQEGLGAKFMKCVRMKIESIAERPATYSSKTKKQYREAAIDIFPYTIVYKINETKRLIIIISVHHNKKRPSKKYRR